MLNSIRKCHKLSDFEYVIKHSSHVKINNTKLYEFTNNLEISDKILLIISILIVGILIEHNSLFVK